MVIVILGDLIFQRRLRLSDCCITVYLICVRGSSTETRVAELTEMSAR